MSNVFNTTRLAGHRVLVTGSEPGQSCILDSKMVDFAKAQIAGRAQDQKLDDALGKFLLPVNRALDEHIEASRKLSRFGHSVHPASIIELSKGTEGVEAKPQVSIELDNDGTVIRLIESGQFDMLVWAGNTIELVEVKDEEVAEVFADTDELDEFLRFIGDDKGHKQEALPLEEV